MKVLSVIWKIPDDRIPGFSCDTNGLVIVRDLCEYLGRKIESYLLLGKEYLPAMDFGNIHIVDSEESKIDFKGKSHLEIMIGAFKRALTDIQPDIVHIHDCGDFCRACIKICFEKHIPYVFTAHAFIGKGQEISNMYDRNIIWQEQVYTVPGINIVAVGKGLASRIIKEYPGLKPNQLRVIQNGTDIKAEFVQSDLKSRLGFQGKRLLICPGKITRRKNQLQIVRAFQLLSKTIGEHVGVIFCGNDCLGEELQNAIEEAGMGGVLKYVGVLNRMQMKEFYSISNGMITASITEGLSIAALEAIAYGQPLVMFGDLECAMDLNDKHVSCLAKERTDQALAEAIEQWAVNMWDRDAIIKYAGKFSMDRVADEYIDCYCDILKQYSEGNKNV